MNVISDVENPERSPRFRELIKADSEWDLSGCTVRYVHYPNIRELVDDEELDIGHEIRFYRNEIPEVGTVDEIEHSVLVVRMLEDGSIERIPFASIFSPVLIIDPYQ